MDGVSQLEKVRASRVSFNFFILTTASEYYYSFPSISIAYAGAQFTNTKVDSARQVPASNAILTSGESSTSSAADEEDEAALNSVPEVAADNTTFSHAGREASVISTPLRDEEVGDNPEVYCSIYEVIIAIF